MNFKVPIKNIYFMLCYSWGFLEQLDEKKIESIDKQNFYDFFTEVLIKSLQPLIKKGFDRNYIQKNEEIKTIKGKIDFSNTFKKMSLKTKGTIYCDFEEYSYNVLQNQIIKTTIINLLKIEKLDKDLKQELHKISIYFSEIDRIKLDQKIFKKVLFHRNNTIYKFIINICQLIYENLLLNDEKGEHIFRSFEENEEKMARLFEDFVRKYYQHHRPELKPKKEQIKWNFEKGNTEMIPIMETDISLLDKKSNTKYIIDTKYYKDAVRSNYNKDKFISANLYQLFAYLNNYNNEKNYQMKGILLYPENGKELDYSYKYKDMDIEIKTINLNQDHKNIKKKLEEIISIPDWEIEEKIFEKLSISRTN
jgi:5-methylcytosine-specific restriction enzyme subunit McrC